MTGLLNYTTEIPVDRTLVEIEQALAKAGAQAILKDYDGAGNITTLSFKVLTERGDMGFRLPMNVQAVQQVLNNQVREKKIPRKFHNDLDQAKRVGWRIIRQWLLAQLAIIELRMVKIEQVFLPYAVMRDGKTLYETFEEKGFNVLLPEPEEKRDYKVIEGDSDFG